MSLLAFSPSFTITLGLTTAQNNITVSGNGHYIRCVNGGTGNAYLQFYEASQAPPTLTALGALLLPPGAIEIFSVASDTTRVAALGDATGTTLSLTRGDGQ
jgi:hypothetical protein